MDLLNSYLPEQNGRRFDADIFKSIPSNDKARISVKISLNFVPMGPIDNIPALVQMGRRQAIICTNVDVFYWRIYSSLGLNELIVCRDSHLDLLSQTDDSYYDITDFIIVCSVVKNNCKLLFRNHEVKFSSYELRKFAKCCEFGQMIKSLLGGICLFQAHIMTPV